MVSRRRRLPNHAAVGGQPLFQRAGLIDRPHRRVGTIGRDPGQGAIEQGADRIDVPPRIGHGLQVRLLRRHVEQRPKRRRLLVRQAGLAEIRQPRAAVLIEQHVGGLQIAVQHAFVVGVDQAGDDLAEQLRGLAGRQRPMFRQMLVQRTMLQVLHHVVGRLRIPTHIQQLDDVAIGGEKHQLLHLAREQRPVNAAAVGVELDRDRARRCSGPRRPRLRHRRRRRESVQLIAGDLGGRAGPLQAQITSSLLVVGRLVFRLVRHRSVLVSVKSRTARRAATSNVP